MLAFYYISNGKIGGADIKILIGLAIALNIESFILQIIFATSLALVFVVINKGFKKKIENIRLIPFIAISYILVLNFSFWVSNMFN